MNTQTIASYIDSAHAALTKHRRYLYDSSWQTKQHKPTKANRTTAAKHRALFERRVRGLDMAARRLVVASRCCPSTANA